MLAAAIGGFLLLVGTLVVPEAGTLAFLFVVYTNLPAIASQLHGVPQSIAAAAIVLIAVPFGLYVFLRRQRLVLDIPFALMIVFLVAAVLSTYVARDRGVALRWIWTYLSEGLLLYLLVVNTVRGLLTLRRALWVLITAGSLLGCLSLYQEVSHSYHQQFAGLAQRDIERAPAPARQDLGGASPVKVRLRDRAAGPIGDPNRYAQILIVLLPIALLRIRAEQRRALKVLAAFAAVTILAGIMLSYSRGAFLALALLVPAMGLLGYIRSRHVLIAAVVAVVLAPIVGPRYLARMDTIWIVPDLLSNARAEPVQADGAIRGRLTEMLAAYTVFRDYPIIGVGPGQFLPFYSVEYMDNRDIAFRGIGRVRRAHSLYLELAAETGIIGVVTFMTIVCFIGQRLWRARKRWLRTHPALADLATTFLLSLMGYLATALFLQLSYQRYYWLLLGLAGAAVQILTSPTGPVATIRQPVPRVGAHEASMVVARDGRYPVKPRKALSV